MKLPFYGLLLVLLCQCKPTPKNPDTLTSGVAFSLAEQRAKDISKVHYQLTFSIPAAKEEPIPTSEKVTLTLANTEHDLLLDFKEEAQKLKSISVNQKEVSISHEKEHIIIPKEHLVQGSNEIDIDFFMGELSLNRNEDYLYTLLVPDRARTVFPCFDQPNLKATYTLTITTPKGWTALCGAPLVKETATAETTTYHFKETDKMSTYLFSFVAGEFKKVQDTAAQLRMTLLYRETDTTAITMSVPSIFELHKQSIDFLEEYTAYAFPFQKLDYASIPGFQYGGMEHVGAIQYRESALFLDQTATQNSLLGRAKLIAHESSHMWFGDLVTMDWFNDVWMKEVFANFMADKIVNPAFPEVNHTLAFMTTHYPRAYGEDRTKGTNPIRQELANLSDAGSLYGSIIYNKAPIMMRQLEAFVGKENFKKGIQAYIKDYAYGNAVWNDLVALLDQQSPKDVRTWSDIWVNKAGRPVFTEDISYDDNGNIVDFTLTQKAEDHSDKVWPQIFEITLVYPDTLTTITVDTQQATTNIVEATGLTKPLAIFYNTNGMGYGVFPQPSKQFEQLQDEVAKGYTYINLYENVLNGSLSSASAYELYTTYGLKEQNELLLSLASGYLRSIFWTFFTEKERLEHAPELENTLWKALQQNAPKNITKTLFNTYKGIVHSDEGKEHLYNIWKKELAIPNLELNKDSYTDLAMTLALYEHPKTETILTDARKAIDNPDKLKRFDFLRPTLSADTIVRDTFYQSLAQLENREKEAWTQTALSYLNHPLRQKQAIKHLDFSLGLLEEVQQTGDIFFPKGWLNNTVGQYTSAEAYRIVEQFIATHPDLNPALLKKLLQASDNLYRVQQLQEKDATKED